MTRPTPFGIKPWGVHLVSAGRQATGLSHGPNLPWWKSPWLLKQRKGLLPAIALLPAIGGSMQARNFCPRFDTVFINEIYIGGECRGIPSSLHLPPQSILHHWFGATPNKVGFNPFKGLITWRISARLLNEILWKSNCRLHGLSKPG